MFFAITDHILNILTDNYKNKFTLPRIMKTRPVPKWIMQCYALLWHKFKEKEFTYEEVFKSFIKDSDNMRRALISQIRVNGWLTVQLDFKDSRKRSFKLKSPEGAVSDMI